MEVEKEGKNERACSNNKPPETDLFIQWGKRKRLRFVRARDNPENSGDQSNGGGGGRFPRKITSRVFTTTSPAKGNPLVQPSPNIRNSEVAKFRSEDRKSASPEKEDRYYTTRGSVDGGERVGGGDDDNRRAVWPKLYIALSSKEKEEDFMAMKGCKPPQRPKKRAKIIQRTLLLVSPGAWLSDMCQERYEVREKKTSKKRPRGLKAMGSMESDSE